MIIKGKVIKVGDHIDTDVIIPARYLNISEPMELAKYCMIDYDKDFLKKVVKGDIMVAGVNFGCGSSREHAPLAIKAAGISCIIAKSFARIFFRNAINIGLPILECPELAESVTANEKLEIDLSRGIIKNSAGKEFVAVPFPPFMQAIINDGGLINYTRRLSDL